MPETKMELQRIENVSALRAIIREEADVAVVTAKQYPRSIERAASVASALVLSSTESAAECFYALPRGGKWLTGPSIRFAELLQHSWGNCRSAARIIAEDDKRIVAQGVFFDCETNITLSIERQRSIVYGKNSDRRGEKFDDDMVNVTGNAACSIALRQAILQGIPKALWRPIYSQIEGVITDPKTISATREKALSYFADKGFAPAKVCALVHVEGADKIGPKEIFLLRGLRNSVEDGDISMEQAFRNAKPIPSMPRERKPPKETKPTKPETKAAKAETPKPKPATKPKKGEPVAQVARITEKQRGQLFSIASRKNADYDTVQKIVRSALSSFGFADSKSVTVDKFEALCAVLRGEE